MQPIDELDRKLANDMRLRLTPANPHLREFVHDAHAHGTLPASFAFVLRQTYISAKASHNVFVVDRHGYDPWRFHATDLRDRHVFRP